MADHPYAGSSNKNNREVLPGRARETIFNVYKFFENDKMRANELIRDLNQASIQRTLDGIPISYKLFEDITEFLKASVRVTERVAKSTGINKNTVTRIRQEGLEAAADGNRIPTPVRKTRGKSIVLDNCDLYALSKVIIKLYVQDNSVPSLNKILSKAKSDLNFKGSMTTLRRILAQQLGFKLKRFADKTKQLTITRPNISGDNSSDEELDSGYTEVNHTSEIILVEALNDEEKT